MRKGERRGEIKIGKRGEKSSDDVRTAPKVHRDEVGRTRRAGEKTTNGVRKEAAFGA